MKLILSIDQGTSSTRCLLFQVDDRNFVLRESHQEPLTQLYPKPGWIEQDPMVHNSYYFVPYYSLLIGDLGNC